MSVGHLFFLNNRLESGAPVLDGKGRVPLAEGLSRAVQLVNLGFHCKQVGWMPSRLDVRLVRATRNGWLFVPDHFIDYVPYEEPAFRSMLRSALRGLLTLRADLDESVPLEDVLQNYPRAVTRAIDELSDTEQSLIHFKWRILEAAEPVPMDPHLMSFHFSNAEGIPDAVQTVLYRSGPVLSAWMNQIHTMVDHLEASAKPFGCYVRFARDHAYLRLPIHGIDQVSASRKLFDELNEWARSRSGSMDPVCFAVDEDALDVYSAEAFGKIAAVIPLRLAILSARPFSQQWDERILAGDTAIWNPRLETGIHVTSSVLPHFYLSAKSSTAARWSDNRLALFMRLMEQTEPGREATIEQLGFDPHALVEDEKERDRLQSRGLMDADGNILPRFGEDPETVSREIRRVIRDEPEKLDNAMDRLKSQFHLPSVQCEAESGDMDALVHAFLCLNAERFDDAAEAFLSLETIPSPALPWAADTLLKAGRISELSGLCEETGFSCSADRFARFQRGEDCDPEELEPEHRFEYLLMRNRAEDLKREIAEYGKRTGRDSLALEMEGAARLGHDSRRGIDTLEQALRVAQQEGSLYRQAMILKRIGNAHFRLQDFTEAEACYLSAMELQASLGNRFQYDTVSYNLAMVAINLCQLDKAEDVIRRDLKQNRSDGHQLYTLFNLKALAKIQAFRSLFSEAHKMLDKAQTVAVENGFAQELPGIHYMRVSVLIGLGRLEAASAELGALAELTNDDPRWQVQLELLRADLFRRSRNRDGLCECLSRLREMKLGEDDERYVAVLASLLDEKPLAHVVDLFTDLGNTAHVQFRLFARIWLLDGYPELAALVDEDTLESEWRLADRFNQTFAKTFQKHLTRRRRGTLVPRFMEMMGRVVRHAREREPTSFEDALQDVGNWLGTGRLTIHQWEPGFSDDERQLLRDSRGSLFLEAESVADDQTRTALQLLVDTLAAVGVPRISSSVRQEPSHACPYLAMIVGRSKPIREMKEEIRKAAGFPFPVLIRGESGTGKELAARAVHFCSGRKNRPFLAVNCAALPEHLIESELFGHARGAFTGAVGSRQGLLEAAGSGTVFLDEIGEMPVMTQVKLLRVLQEREFFRLGETRPRSVNARFLFATNRDLEQAVKAGEFREDLYYRIAGFAIILPPLNERREDIPLLCSHFLADMDDGRGKQLSSAAESLIQQHHFRGNVRELQNILMASIINSGEGMEIQPEHLPGYVNPVGMPFSGELKQATKAFQKQYLHNVLEETGYNNSRSGRILGITRQRVIQLRKEFGL